MDTIKLKSFTKDWWKSFLEINQNFTQTCVLEDCVDEDLVAKLQLGVLEVLKERLVRGDVAEGFRVYLDNKEKDDYFLKDFCETPPLDNENIEEYAERVFDQKFGIIINYGEKHSDIISHHIIKRLQPLMELVGVPPLGVDITIFIGNYGWTPLGIHQDRRGENVIHFHLGPGSKTMYTWDEDVYEKLTGSEQNNHEIEAILEHANKYPFKAGDIYYMPWNKFHVGLSDELSVGVTVWFNNAPRHKYVNRVLESFAYQVLTEDDSIINIQKDYLENDDSFQDLLATIKLDKDIMDYSFKDFMKFIYEEFKFATMSNGGWQSVPLSLEVREKYNVDDFEELRGKTIIAHSPFKIYYKKYKQSLWVYARGSKFEMRYFDELVTIIDKINTNEEILVDDLLKIIPENFPPEAVLYFLSLTLNKRGIEVI